MDDFVVNVRQIVQYPQIAGASPTDAILIQQGGLGGPYGWTTPAGLLAPLSTQRVTLGGLDLVGSLAWVGTPAELIVDQAGFGFVWGNTPAAQLRPDGSAVFAGRVTAAGPIFPNELATAQYVTDNTVWTFNGRRGDIQLTLLDLMDAGGAPSFQPHFTGYPTVPNVLDWRQTDDVIANTRFVQDAIHGRLTDMFATVPLVFTFNGRKGNICLEVEDIVCAGGAPIDSPHFTGRPTAPSPGMSNVSDELATTRWVWWQIDAINRSLDDLAAQVAENIDTSQFATLDFVAQTYAPLNNAQLTGFVSAPTAAPGTNSGQIATTAFVMQAVAESIAGVATWNGRSGNVVLTDGDLQDRSVAFLNSPQFIGVPSGPTAPLHTDTTQLATTEFVMNELTAINTGVLLWNGRSGNVNMTLLDVTGVGGAPIASPTFTGNPTAPTPAASDNDTSIATTAFVHNAINAISAGVTSFEGRTGAVQLQSSDISARGGALLASPAFTGTPTAPTAVVGTSTTQLATTAFVQAAIAATTGVSTWNGRAGNVTLQAADLSLVGGALLAGPAFTGTPTAPTAAPGTSTTQLATTEFVASQGVRYDAPQGLAVTQQTQARQNIYAAPFDALAYNGMQVNGSCEISQEKGTAATVSGYVIDGWAVWATSGISAQQVTDAPPGFTNSVRVNITQAVPSPAGTDYVIVQQPLEGFRVARLGFGTANAQPVSFGFYVKASRAGTYSACLVNQTKTRSYPLPVVINAANTWEFKTATIPGDLVGAWPGLNALSMYFSIALMAGATLQAPGNAWYGQNLAAVTGTINGAASTSDFLQITGLIILPGIEVPTAARLPFIMRPNTNEWPLCERYWQKLTAGGQMYTASLAQWLALMFPCPVSMRAPPTITLGAVTYTAAASASFDTISAASFRLVWTSTNAQAQSGVIADVVLDARL